MEGKLSRRPVRLGSYLPFIKELLKKCRCFKLHVYCFDTLKKSDLWEYFIERRVLLGLECRDRRLPLHWHQILEGPASKVLSVRLQYVGKWNGWHCRPDIEAVLLLTQTSCFSVISHHQNLLRCMANIFLTGRNDQTDLT